MSSSAKRSHAATWPAESATPRREASRASAANGAEVAGTLAIVGALRSRTFGRVLIALSLFTVLAALAGTAYAASAAVAIDGFRFVPQSVTVGLGETMTWTNRDPVTHTATAAGAFDTGVLVTGQSKTIQMNAAGTFE